MSKHTPGPWHTNGYSSPLTGAITVYHKPFGLSDVAEVHDIHDAYLIASAPQLLEALRTLDARLRACMDAPTAAADAYDSFYQAVVSDAIKAAEGA